MRMRTLDNERGAVVAVVALCLFAFMGMVVLVVDVGGLLNMRRRMVVAADSAALAAAQSCGQEQPDDAPIQADLLATSNQSEALRNEFDTTDCGTSSSGSVHVAYEAPMQLFFAPILGAGEEMTIPAEATAIWGPAGGAAPMPIELSVDDQGVFPCAYQAPGTTCAYWHDNSEDLGTGNSSSWGFMNLNGAGVEADASCPNAGANERADWINQDIRAKLTIHPDTGYTYVCMDGGHAASNWYAALENRVGDVVYFPVNDPDRMITGTGGKDKYAIIGFVPLQLDEVLKGNDPRAIGTPGASGSCTKTHTFNPNTTLSLDSLGCYTGADEITNISVTKKVGGKTTTYVEGTDFTYDPTNRSITWWGPTVNDSTLKFDWSQFGAQGLCGNRRSDPNAVCLVTSWQGVQVAGSLPGGGEDFGLRAVRLSE